MGGNESIKSFCAGTLSPLALSSFGKTTTAVRRMQSFMKLSETDDTKDMAWVFQSAFRMDLHARMYELT